MTGIIRRVIASAVIFSMLLASLIQTYAFNLPPAPLIEGKSILFLGDSINSGYKLDYSVTFNKHLATDYGMNVRNVSYPGSTVGISDTYGRKPGGYKAPLLRRTLPISNYDIVIVNGGANDWYCEIPIGDDINSKDIYTYIGALNVTFDRLQIYYPCAELVFMTLWNSVSEPNGKGNYQWEYDQAAESVCAARGITVFSVNDPLVGGIDASDPDIHKALFLDETDAWHLNEDGQTVFLPYIAAWLNEFTAQKIQVYSFYDVKRKYWYAEDVAFMYENHLMFGMKEDSFAPSVTATRGQLASVLYRLAGSPESQGNASFTDLSLESQYYTAVSWASAAGIMNGLANDKFDLEADLTREQLATCLYRYSCYMGYDTNNSGPLNQFSDANKISPWARDAICWSSDRGIICETVRSAIRPKKTVTRAELASVIHRYCILYNLLTIT